MNVEIASSLLLLVGSLAGSLTAARAGDDESLKVYGKEVLRMDSADKQSQLKIGGRIQNDWVWWTGENDVENFLGDDLDDVSAGVNWYLNPNARVMLDYVHADLRDVGSADAFVTRFQAHF